MVKDKTMLESLIESKGETLKSASLAIGKNHSYLFQFVNKGSPRVFPERERRMLSEFLGVEEGYLKDVLDGRGDSGFSDKSDSPGFRHISPAITSSNTKDKAKKAAGKLAKILLKETGYETNKDFAKELEWEIFKEMWSLEVEDLDYTTLQKLFDRQIIIYKNK